MKRHIIAASALTALAVLSLAVMAQVKGQRVTSYVLANGTFSCGDAIQNFEKLGEVAENDSLTWMQGFISGRNLERSRNRADGMVGEGVSHQTLIAAFKKKCRDEPFKNSPCRSQRSTATKRWVTVFPRRPRSALVK